MSVVVIGGGLSGLAAALWLVARGWEVTVVEREPELGGLARSLRRDGRLLPLAYHHILANDTPLLERLETLGLASRVHWSTHRMGFWLEGGAHELGSVRGALTFPLPLRTRLGLAGLGARVFLSRPAPVHLDAHRWLEHRGGTASARAFVDDLVRIRFGHCTRDLSAAYLQRRLSAREMVTRLGCIPGTDWCWVLVDALRRRLEAAGARIITGCGVQAFRRQGDQLAGVTLEDGRFCAASAAVSTVHPEAFAALAPDLAPAAFDGRRSTSVLSLVVAVEGEPLLDHYWTLFLDPASSFGMLFQLDRLNPAMAPEGRSLLNFVSHGEAGAAEGWWARSDEAILEGFLRDLERQVGVRPAVAWHHLTRIRSYTPFYRAGYRNPPVQCPGLPALFLAGNHTTFPEIATTGMAMQSGERAAARLHDHCARGLAPLRMAR